MKNEIILQDIVTDKGGHFVMGCLYVCAAILFAFGAIVLICVSAIFSY